jgi:tellurite resistance protein
MPTTFSAQDALVATMVLTAAADGAMSEPETRSVARMLDGIPSLAGFDQSRFGEISAVVVEMLGEEEGIDQTFDLIAGALPDRLRETAYALACDVAAADGAVEIEETRLLELMRHALGVERLAAAAIERGARARHARLKG